MSSTDSGDTKKTGLLDKETLEKYKAFIGKDRYVVEMSRDELYTLKKLCDEQGIDADEALRRAIKTEYYMRTKLKQHFKVLVQSPNKQMFEVVFDD